MFDAGTAWNEMIRYDFMLPEFEPAKTLQQKYSISVDTSLGGRPILPKKVVLSTIWGSARKHIENASSPNVDALATNQTLTTASSQSALSTQSDSNKSGGILDGRWKVTIYVANQSAPTVLSFTKVGNGYVGAATSSDGTTTFANITFDGTNVTFTASDKVDNQQVSIQGNGEVQGDSISGVMKISSILTGQTVESRFAGNRLK